MRDRGVEFLYVPEEYYDNLLERVGDIDEEIETLKEHGILIDRDEEGYLLQLFTKTIVDMPTLFIEIFIVKMPNLLVLVISKRCSRLLKGSNRQEVRFKQVLTLMTWVRPDSCLGLKTIK